MPLNEELSITSRPVSVSYAWEHGRAVGMLLPEMLTETDFAMLFFDMVVLESRSLPAASLFLFHENRTMCTRRESLIWLGLSPSISDCSSSSRRAQRWHRRHHVYSRSAWLCRSPGLLLTAGRHAFVAGILTSSSRSRSFTTTTARTPRAAQVRTSGHKPLPHATSRPWVCRFVRRRLAADLAQPMSLGPCT